MSASAAELDPVGGVDANQKPVFLSTHHAQFTAHPNEQMSDVEAMEWRTFRLWKNTNGMIRRDRIYKGITTTDSHPQLLQKILGTPFPTIEPAPTYYEVLSCMRWYEHSAPLIFLGASALFFAQPALKDRPMVGGLRRAALVVGAACSESIMGYRSLKRLTGQSPNDYECRRYGVLEDKARLEEKVRHWTRYAAFKSEWMDRWNYYHWGMRPGETWHWWSPCILPAAAVRYNTVTDYPLRKNPLTVTDKPLRTMAVDSPFSVDYPAEGTRDTVPIYAARPELQYMFRGPLGPSRLGDETYRGEGA